MPKHRNTENKHHHRNNSDTHDNMPAGLSRSHRVHDISIFNNVTVNAPVKQESDTTVDKKEDGCTSCFKSMFGALRR